MRRPKHFLWFSLLLLLAGPVCALTTEVFQCTAARGAITFQDHPCTSDEQELIKAIDTSAPTNPPPVVESTKEAAPDSSPEAQPAEPGLKQRCGGIRIQSYSPLGISLEYTTAPELDGFWGDEVRGLERRPNIKLETYNKDVNDVAVCANIRFVLSTFGGRINWQNNLGRALRSRFVARSSNGRTATAKSGSFPDGRIKLGATYSGTYCFWKGSQAGGIIELGCR